MFFSSSVYAIALATSTISPSSYGCISCQQATIYMPNPPILQITEIAEPAMRESPLWPDDSQKANEL